MALNQSLVKKRKMNCKTLFLVFIIVIYNACKVNEYAAKRLIKGGCVNLNFKKLNKTINAHQISDICSRTKIIDLSYQRIDTLLLEDTYPNLTKVTLGFCEIKNIDKLIRNLYKYSKIKSLNIFLGNLNSFPKGLYHLDSLKSLDLEFNKRINHLPGEFKKLKNIEEISLKNLVVDKEAQIQLKGFKNLKELQLIKCNLKKIPDFIGNLPNLEILVLDNNPIETLDVSFERFKSIRKVSLIDTELSNVVLNNYSQFMQSSTYNNFKEKCNDCEVTFFLVLDYK